VVTWDFCIFLLGRIDTLLYVVLINQVYDHFYHDILFFRPTLSYHQREGDKGAVGDAIFLIAKERGHGLDTYRRGRVRILLPNQGR